MTMRKHKGSRNYARLPSRETAQVKANDIAFNFLLGQQGVSSPVEQQMRAFIKMIQRAAAAESARVPVLSPGGKVRYFVRKRPVTTNFDTQRIERAEKLRALRRQRNVNLLDKSA